MVLHVQTHILNLHSVCSPACFSQSIDIHTIPVTCKSYGSLLYSTPSITTEQFNTPLSVTSISVILIVCSSTMSAKHPVEHPQTKSLSLNVSVELTSQVKVMLDPIRCSNVLLSTSTRAPGGSLTMVTVTKASVYYT